MNPEKDGQTTEIVPEQVFDEDHEEEIDRDEWNRQWQEEKKARHDENVRGLVFSRWRHTLYINGVGQHKKKRIK